MIPPETLAEWKRLLKDKWLSKRPWTAKHWHGEDGMPHTEVHDADGNFVAAFDNLINAEAVEKFVSGLEATISALEEQGREIDRLKKAPRKMEAVVEAAKEETDAENKVNDYNDETAVHEWDNKIFDELQLSAFNAQNKRRDAVDALNALEAGK